MLKDLCLLNGASGNEGSVREYIISQINDKCDYTIDPLGSIIATVGKKEKSISVNAHMDEVGFIVTGITDDGYVQFDSIGSVEPKVCLDKNVVFENGTKGVIGDKAFHLLSKDEREVHPSFDKLLIDIGASSNDEAKSLISLGDYIYFESEYIEFGNDMIKSKALDSRIDCQILIDLISDGVEATYCFNTQDKVGHRGAKCTANQVNAKFSISVSCSPACDFDDVNVKDKICSLGKGAVISFMDSKTIYDKKLFNLANDIAKEKEIPVQVKKSIVGETDACSVQTSGNGVKVLSISVPARYINSASTVANKSDIEATKMLLKELITRIYDL